MLVTILQFCLRQPFCMLSLSAESFLTWLGCYVDACQVAAPRRTGVTDSARAFFLINPSHSNTCFYDETVLFDKFSILHHWYCFLASLLRVCINTNKESNVLKSHKKKNQKEIRVKSVFVFVKKHWMFLFNDGLDSDIWRVRALSIQTL